MALANVISVLDRAIDDPAFRVQLLGDPTAALVGHDLTKTEHTMLCGLASSPYTASPRGLADVRKMAAGALAYGGDTADERSSTTR